MLSFVSFCLKARNFLKCNHCIFLQLTQFVREVKKSPFGGEVSLVSLFNRVAGSKSIQADSQAVFEIII
jgi:hypothetical protein